MEDLRLVLAVITPGSRSVPFACCLLEMGAKEQSSPSIVLPKIILPLVILKRRRWLTCISENLTSKATKRATDTRQLFAARVAKCKVPRPEALVDLGKLCKVILLW